jgi:hypothetical protein
MLAHWLMLRDRHDVQAWWLDLLKHMSSCGLLIGWHEHRPRPKFAGSAAAAEFDQVSPHHRSAGALLAVAA